MDWMYIVRVAGSVVDLAVFWVGVLHIILLWKLVVLYMYVSMYMSCCCFKCNFVKFVCSRKANFYVLHMLF